MLSCYSFIGLCHRMGRWADGLEPDGFDTGGKRILSRCLLNEGRLSILSRCPLSSHRLTPRFSFCLEREGTEMSRCHFPSPHPFNMEQNLGDASLIGVFHSSLVSLISHNQPCFGLLISLESLFFFSPLRFLQPRSLGFRENSSCRAP